jgi:predicted dehydrogenase
VSTMKLGMSVIGTGSLGFHHARLLRELPEVDLVGIYDVNAERLAEVAATLGVTAYDAAEELLERSDACVIAVPTEAHEAVALAALERGVHVLIEKPIAPSLAAADRILEAAQGADRLVQIGHVERFNGALRACERYLEGPRFIESHRLAPFNPRGTDVAVVLDLMIHDLDLVLSMIGQPVDRVAAIGVPVLTRSTDIANARLEFAGGAVANLTASRVSLERMRKIRFFQPTGYISLDLANGTGEFLRLRPGALAALAAGAGGAGGGVPALDQIVERIPLRGDGAEPLRAELLSFADAVRGRSPVTVPGEAGRAALAVALEIVERIETHVAHRPASGS